MRYILILLALSLSTQVLASGDRTSVSTHNITYNYNTVADAKGVAIAIASAQHHFDYGVYSWQGSVGVGFYHGEEAASFGVGKRVGKVLMSGSVTPESVGVGATWRW